MERQPPDDSVPAPEFDPVRTGSTRHDGWTPDRQCAFIAALNVMGAVSPAARAVGMTARSAYKLRARPDAASFTRAWDQAIHTGRERAYEIVIERAIHGVVTPRYYRGKEVGTRHHYDYRLLMAAIARPHPLEQQSCAMNGASANFANFEAILDRRTDPVDPAVPCP